MTKPTKRLRPFIVAVANDLTEYAYVRVFATADNIAKTTITDLIGSNKPPQLQFEPGDDREGPYIVDVSQDRNDHPWVTLTIKDGETVPPKPFRLKCPHCGYEGKEPSEHGGTFRLLSDTTIYREIIRVQRAKKDKPRTMIANEAFDQYYEDPEKNDRIECRSCLKEFPLPKDLPVDYI